MQEIDQPTDAAVGLTRSVKLNGFLQDRHVEWRLEQLDRQGEGLHIGQPTMGYGDALGADDHARHMDEGGRDQLSGVVAVIAGCESFDAATIEAAVKAYAESAGVKLGQIAQPLRAALTGRATSPGIFDVLAVLGREESLCRINNQLTK